MELRHLRYFVVVAEEMNIHRAAERLHISQPPLSVAIKQLEQEIGTPLFYRQGRGIQITRAGEYFLEQAQDILSQAQEVANNTRQIGEGKRGVLRIRFISSAVTGILQNSIALFQKTHPDIVLDIKQFYTLRAIEWVEKGDADVAIIRYPQNIPDTLQAINVTEDNWAVAMQEDHLLAAKKEISFNDLKNLPLIFFPRWNSPDEYDDATNMFREKGLDFLPALEATEQTAIAGLVASGMGLGVVPGCMAKIGFQSVVHRPLEGTEGRTGFMFVIKKNADVNVQQFVDCAISVSKCKGKKA